MLLIFPQIFPSSSLLSSGSFRTELYRRPIVGLSCYIGYLATVLRTCIKTITIIVYKMVVLLMVVAPAQCCFLFVFCNFFVIV